MLTLRLDSPTPLADQIVAGIRCAIASRELGASDSLPTVRQLAGDLGINMNTVARAYRSLEAAGLVYTRRGRGTIVRADRCTKTAADPDVRAELVGRLREVLADLRLAGVECKAARVLIDSQLEELWSEEKWT